MDLEPDIIHANEIFRRLIFLINGIQVPWNEALKRFEAEVEGGGGGGASPTFALSYNGDFDVLFNVVAGGVDGHNPTINLIKGANGTVLGVDNTGAVGWYAAGSSTIAGLTDTDVLSAVDGMVLQRVGGLWTGVPQQTLPTSTNALPGTLQIASSGFAGAVSTQYANPGHIHPVPSPGTPAVLDTANPNSNVGAGSGFARDTHSHGITAHTHATVAPSAVAPAVLSADVATSSQGAGTGLARDTHVHGISAHTHALVAHTHTPNPTQYNGAAALASANSAPITSQMSWSINNGHCIGAALWEFSLNASHTGYIRFSPPAGGTPAVQDLMMIGYGRANYNGALAQANYGAGNLQFDLQLLWQPGSGYIIMDIANRGASFARPSGAGHSFMYLLWVSFSYPI